MLRMIRSEVEISASVGEFSVNFSGQCDPFADDQNIQKRNRFVGLYFHSSLCSLEIPDDGQSPKTQ
jgi:hypothetical protein